MHPGDNVNGDALRLLSEDGGTARDSGRPGRPRSAPPKRRQRRRVVGAAALTAAALKHLAIPELHGIVGGGEYRIKPGDAIVRGAGGCRDCHMITKAVGVVDGEGTYGDVVSVSNGVNTRRGSPLAGSAG